MTPLHTSESTQLGAALAGRITMGCGLAGLVMLGAAAALGAGSGGGEGWASFMRAYLLGFCFVLTLSLGGLFFTMLQHLTRAGWSVVVRRVAEGLAGNLKWLWIAFLPLAFIMFTGRGTLLYAWADPAVTTPGSAVFDEVLWKKAAWLEPNFWLIRAGAYFLVWGVLAWYFTRTSREQDSTGDPQLTRQMQAVAAPAMILFAITQTFAAIDWIMSLEAHWFSTMYGVYFFAGSACGFFALSILICRALQRAGKLREMTTEHFHDLGKALFAFGIVFWAYIAYSQFMLIWYANLPEETGWFMARQFGQWKWVSLFLLLGHFVVPFVLIISRHPKRMPGVLSVAAAWMLFMQAVDLYYLIMPVVPHEALHEAESYTQVAAQFADVTIGLTPAHALCVLGMLSLLLAGTAVNLRSAPLIPVRDPRLHESLAFENI